jgi:hypothetical protein
LVVSATALYGVRVITIAALCSTVAERGTRMIVFNFTPSRIGIMTVRRS